MSVAGLRDDLQRTGSMPRALIRDAIVPVSFRQIYKPCIDASPEPDLARPEPTATEPELPRGSRAASGRRSSGGRGRVRGRVPARWMVQALSRASCGVPIGRPVQDGVLVAVVGGGVDREAEGVRGAAVAQPAQRDGLTAAQDAGDVGERSAVSDLHCLQLGPVLFRVVQQPQGDRAAGRVRDGWHVFIVPPGGHLRWLSSRARERITSVCSARERRCRCLRAVPVTLTAAERKTLKKRVRGARTPWRDRLRAQIVLAAARGRANARIAADLGISEDTARKWRGRFAQHAWTG